MTGTPYARKYKKKNNRKPKRTYAKKAVIRHMSTGFPDRVRVNLKYSDVITLTTGVAGTALHVFRGNSVYDPDLTGTGHQPLFRDNYAAVYLKYCVTAARMTIKAINTDGTSAALIMCVPSTTQFGLSDVNAVSTLEQVSAACTQMMPVASRYPTYLKSYATSTRMLGLRKGQIWDDSYSSVISSQTSSEWFFNIGLLSANAASGVIAKLQILITYTVEFYDREKQVEN